jgi:glutaredoxin
MFGLLILGMLLPAVLMVSLFSRTAQAQVYKITGPDGKVSYTDKAPDKNQKSRQLNLAALPTTPIPAELSRLQDEMLKSANKRTEENRNPSVNLFFTAAWCGYCKQAKAYMAAKRISMPEYDIDTPTGRQAFLKAGGGGGVPLLLWKGQRVQGFSPAAYDQVFTRN